MSTSIPQRHDHARAIASRDRALTRLRRLRHATAVLTLAMVMGFSVLAIGATPAFNRKRAAVVALAQAKSVTRSTADGTSSSNGDSKAARRSRYERELRAARRAKAAWKARLAQASSTASQSSSASTPSSSPSPSVQVTPQPTYVAPAPTPQPTYTPPAPSPQPAIVVSGGS